MTSTIATTTATKMTSAEKLYTMKSSASSPDLILSTPATTTTPSATTTVLAIGFSGPAKPVSQLKATAVGKALSKAMGIIGELRASLDHAAGGDISRDLDRLYEFVLDQLSQANLQRTPNGVNAAIDVMRTLKEGWDGIVPA